ncbi:Phosphohistidine phosphatase SixA [Paramagnetospirillum magnetotacticum MS-1]|uniref:Phosphohistidine phosphatase SixA n=1 Tax=Paramagnetospirillum magnetotacticum MS-1 TaxID=272627 RepID=A0A0C2YUU0_PARME|nr:histidine phosphatase family protein [Paramagnetospirillum magnetotacticum]KIL98465.1 Phosphohistidine phosphatase SixA [Paramagnetospirillum magnetotacticum MS-1]
MTEAVTDMRKLFLLRHAKSSWDDPGMDDFDRPLNGRGRKDARRMGQYMARQGFRPGIALVSGAARTRATWELIEPHLEGVPVAIEGELYEATKARLLDRLRQMDDHMESVLLIGHNPGIGRLAEVLADHHGAPALLARLAEKFPTGALAVLELDISHWGELEAGRGSLATFIRPKDLETPSPAGESAL